MSKASPQPSVSFAFIAGSLATLAMLYLVGDGWLLGELVAPWPPLVWCVILAPRLVLLAWRGHRVEFGLCLGAALAFLALTTEWPPLLRRVAKKGAAARHVDRDTHAMRVVTWNVAGGMPWSDLEGAAPDLALLQESTAPGLLAGRWAGFFWLQADDPAALSRFPMTKLATRAVGPWTPPQVLALRHPTGREIIVVNARLMLPAIVVAVANLESPTGLMRLHQERVAQFRNLANLLDETLDTRNTESAIVCGDFNTPADAASLEPLRVRLTDAWSLAGAGWGGTMTAALPVSRIDQCWVTRDLTPVSAAVRKGASDHRMLVVDLVFRSGP